MEYQIIMDSCGELTEEMKNLGIVSSVPLTLQVGDTEVIDDAAFNQADFLKLVASTDVQHVLPPNSINSLSILTQNVYI